MTSSRPVPLLVLVVGLIVALVVVIAFHLDGWPDEVRHRRLDHLRTVELQRLAQTIDGFWQTRNRLPASLAEMGATPRRDPESGEVYEYRPDQDGRYQLCAVFSAVFEPEVPDSSRLGVFWTHGDGRNCFSMDAKTAKKP